MSSSFKWKNKFGKEYMCHVLRIFILFFIINSVLMVKYFFEQMDLLAVSLTANAGFLSGTVRPDADLK